MVVAASAWQIVLMALGYLSIALVAVSVVYMILGIRRQRRVRVRVVLAPAVAAIVVLIVYTVVLDVAVVGALSWPLLVAGLALGVVASRTTSLTRSPAGVVGRYSVWHLAVWALTFGVTQALAMSSPAQAVAYGLSTVFFSTGLTTGTSFGLLVSYLAVRGEPVAAATPVAALVPASGASTPAQTASPVADRGVPRAEAGAWCPACGRPARPGARFCGTCGSDLRTG